MMPECPRVAKDWFSKVWMLYHGTRLIWHGMDVIWLSDMMSLWWKKKCDLQTDWLTLACIILGLLLQLKLCWQISYLVCSRAGICNRERNAMNAGERRGWIAILGSLISVIMRTNQHSWSQWWGVTVSWADLRWQLVHNTNNFPN